MKTTEKKQTSYIKKQQVKVTSEKNNIKKIRQIVETITTNMNFDSSEVFNIKLAINEAHANIIEHAYMDKTNSEIIFNFYIYKDKLIVKIKDYSKAIIPKTMYSGENLNKIEGSGLGTFLIKSVMDNVEYIKSQKKGAEIVLTKYKK